MLRRICLVVAILAGIGVAALNFTQIKNKIVDLKTKLAEETKLHQEFQAKFNKTSKELEATNKVLKVTIETLKATTDERDKAVATANSEKTRADKLTDDLAKTRTERDDTKAELQRYVSAGMKPEEIIVAAKTIKGLQDNLGAVEGENRILNQNVKKLKNELAQLRPEPPPVPLPAKLQAKVVAYDPKWEFVVLNAGEDQQVLPYAELLINRHGKLVARVKVSNVEKGRSYANIMPGWKLGDILEGDQAVPAYPES